MKLDSYPQAIFDAEMALADLDQKISELQQTIEQIEQEADISVAFDNDLKNELQRKARKAQILNHDQVFQTSSDTLLKLKNTRRVKDAEYTFLRNRFGAAKLLARLELASAVKTDEARDLVGV